MRIWNNLMKIKILIPIFNDWQSLFKLMYEIDKLSLSSEFQVSLVVVNDASNHDRQDEIIEFKRIALG